MTVCLRACKRCGGDMSYESDIYGRFLQCLQCSYLEGLPSKQLAEGTKKSVEVPLLVVGAVEKTSPLRR
jgi:DNA-directed RNA polymerase subunit M/transcription elongation factor TFIIS